jgi:hypothetical protein
LKVKDVQSLFREIVILDFQRILSRLRSRHAKSRKAFGKRAIIAQLNEVISHESIKARQSITKKKLKALREMARSLEDLFVKLECISDSSANTSILQQILQDIVKGSYEFTIAANLGTVIENFSGNPSLKKHLPEAIGKLGRYYAASVELVCAARDKTCGIFQRIQVESFYVPRPSNIEAPIGKVHAEIQLLFFYELHPNRPKPRFICSSKSACYLCNLFFHLHNGFSIPRTHGKLYEKWLLPDWLDLPVQRQQELGVILTGLKGTVDKKIQRALRSRLRYNHPNESVLLPLAHWPSSSALTRSRVSALASTSTIQIQHAVIREDIAGSGLTIGHDLPLTPPRTPKQSYHCSQNDKQHSPNATAASLVNITHEITPALDTTNVIIIRQNEVPYSLLITETTPSLQLKLEGLLFIVEFVRVFSGRLWIEEVAGAADHTKRLEVLDVKDIPSKTELSLSCSDSTNELTVRFKSDKNGMMSFTFLWNDDGLDTHDLGDEVESAHLNLRELRR